MRDRTFVQHLGTLFLLITVDSAVRAGGPCGASWPRWLLTTDLDEQ
jgi:hypothetical protein